MKEEAGQLFRDIAIAVTAAVSLSLFVSISVIPMLSKYLFSLGKWKRSNKRAKNPLAGVGARIVTFMVKIVSVVTKNWITRLAVIAGLSILAAVSTVLLFPKMEYLPQGNRNLIINILIPPPGLSFEERKNIGQQIYTMNKPYFGNDNGGYPGIKTMFYVGAEQIMLFGAISQHEQRAGELLPLFRQTIHSIPGMFGISTQAGIFQTRLGRGRTVEVDISGDDLNRIVQAAGTLFGAIRKEIPGVQIRPVPSLELLFPEVRLIPMRDRLKASGMNARDFGLAIDVLMDGRKIGDFKPEGQKKIDLILRASEEDIPTPEELYDALIAIPGGKIVPVSSLATLQRTTGITQIQHLERQRTITLQVTPPFTIPLQEAMETIENKVVAPMIKQ